MKNSKLIQAGIFICLLIVSVITTNAQESFSEETRFPWATSQKDFITDWLAIGGFPNQDGKGFDNDYLQEHGGETGISPVQGMKHSQPNGAVYEWKKYVSPYNYVNFFDILRGTDFNMKVTYVYKNIVRPADGKVILSFGSNVGDKIWINGKEVYSNKSDYASAENNQIEIDMVKGENSILLKSVHGGWTWGFWMRIIEPKNFSLVHDFQLSPSIIESENKDELIIKTDKTLNPAIQKINVNAKVIAAGGEVVSEKTVKRCDKVVFDTEDWGDGVYDICLTSNNNKNEIVTAYLYWYKGDAIQKAKELVESVPENPKTAEDYLIVMLSQLIYDRAGNDLDKVDSSDISKLYPALMEYEELINNTAVRANGFVRLAYVDETDNTPQFCRAYLPMEYDPDKKWPLVVNLHGYNGANPVYVKWWSIDSRHYDLVDKYPVIDIEPHGRGNTSYRGMGEKDVMKCIELAKELFNVDEDRIYLKGESMGGGGTWYVGTRHPDIFAAIAPVYGGWDYHADFTDEQLAKMSDIEKYNRERNSSFAQADALLTTPVFVTHGDIDASVNVKYSRYAVKMLQRWGYDIRYHEYPGFGHEGIRYQDEVIPWFLEHELQSAPEKVRVRSAHLSSAKAHWIKVTQRENPFAFIEAEAEVLINNTIRLTTDNVLEVEIYLPAELINPKEKVTVIWNVNDIREVIPQDGKIILRDKNYRPGQLNKNSQIEGPVAHLTTTPFAVVIGTTSQDSMMNKLCRTKAQDFINYWKEWQKYEPRVFIDTEMSEADMKNYSLLLFGDAQANAVTKKLGNKIPLKISEDKIEIAGKSFNAKDAFVQMVYPHPMNSERYVSVIGATSGAGMYFYDNRDNGYDFVIRDGSIPNNRLGYSTDKIIIARGVFDNSWQINNNFTETGDNDIRKKCPARKVLPDLSTTIENLPKIDPKTYETLSGEYGFNGMVISVFVKSGKLMVKDPQGKVSQLLPSSDLDYILESDDIQLSFTKNESGTIEKVIVYMGSQIIEMAKLK